MLSIVSEQHILKIISSATMLLTWQSATGIIICVEIYIDGRTFAQTISNPYSKPGTLPGYELLISMAGASSAKK